MSSLVKNLFAEPICINKNLQINNDLLLEQLKGVKLLSNKNAKKTYASISKNILNEITYGKDIKKIFNDYAKSNFEALDYITDFEICDSWFTLTEPHAEGSSHFHVNYLCSGCYYPLKTKNEKIKIIFERPNKFQIFPNIKKFISYNSMEQEIEIDEGDLILFPAYLSHRIGYNDSDNKRVSLAFNINPKGEVGWNVDSKYTFK